MSERRDDEQRKIARRVRELEDYCEKNPFIMKLSLEGLRERIEGIPPDAVRGSDFFHYACGNESVTLEMIECLLDTFPEAVQSIDEREGCLPLHWVCMNRRVTLGMVECLLRAFPEAARSSGGNGYSPLHCACAQGKLDPGIVRLLLDRWPESVNRRNNSGDLPLHRLCDSSSAEETDLLAIVDLLLDAAPDSVTLEDDNGDLPICKALRYGHKPPSFYKRLIDAHPESLRVQDGDGYLPIHLACYYGDVKTVKCLIELDPESIDARNREDDLPIHCVVSSFGKHKADIIRYLLAKDPDCASKTGSDQRLPFHYACRRNCLDSVRLLFDAYPEAITIGVAGGRTPLDVARREGGIAVKQFLEEQMGYVLRARDSRAMQTPDEDGWLPLHHALQSGTHLGAIKLLIAANPSALRVAVNQLAFPLHIACEFSTVSVVQHLLGLLDIHLHSLDFQKDSTLHYACRGGNTGVVKYLLERHVPSVSEPNDDDKLPIHLLWESDRVDRDSVEYVEANWLLLLAHTETVTH